MKKELTRRSFLKLAGVGALAVAMSGSLTGCDVIDNLKDMDSVSAAIGDVKFMMSADVVQYGFSNVSENRTVGFLPLCEVRNNSKKAVTYGGSDNNHFCLHGLQGLVVAPGMNSCHSCQEYTSADELTHAARLAEALILARK